MPQFEIQDIQETTSLKIATFLARLSRSPSRVLLLDYDGTLAPFCTDRYRAEPYPGIPELIDQIRNLTNTRVAIVTGRRACEALTRLGLKKIEVWGCHGLSRLRVDGTYELPNLDEGAVDRILEANEILCREGLFELMEFKPAATAVHWRGIGPEAAEVAAKVQKVWSALPSRRGIELLSFDGGMEIRVSGRNKGDVIRTMLAETNGQTAAVAYLGDDQTDEDAFEALPGHGLGVLVRATYRPTMAGAWIRPPQGVATFLTDWLAACGGAS